MEELIYLFGISPLDFHTSRKHKVHRPKVFLPAALYKINCCLIEETPPTRLLLFPGDNDGWTGIFNNRCQNALLLWPRRLIILRRGLPLRRRVFTAA